MNVHELAEQVAEKIRRGRSRPAQDQRWSLWPVDRQRVIAEEIEAAHGRGRMAALMEVYHLIREQLPAPGVEAGVTR